MSQNVSSAAVVIGALRVNDFFKFSVNVRVIIKLAAGKIAKSGSDQVYHYY